MSAMAVCRRTVLFELVHSDVNVGGEANARAVGLSVDCVCVGTLWLGGVAVPPNAASYIPVLGDCGCGG